MPAAESLVCVVIPVYRDPLARAEQAALKQCVSVLHRYPISIVTPERLDAGDHLRCYSQLRNETFPDEFFVSAYSYNKLMLSDAFYARLAGYECILIHQLDAFVFSDQLQDWCMRGYDYVGAPWVWSRVGRPCPVALTWGRAPRLPRASPAVNCPSAVTAGTSFIPITGARCLPGSVTNWTTC